MATVELVYDSDCPNVARARGQLIEAFAVAQVAARWTEWNRSDPSTPLHARRYGSPTILVEGQDVVGVAPGEGADSCRLYQGPAGELTGVPTVEEIARALSRPPAGPRPIEFERSFPMTSKRTIEVFSAGCPACEETIELVNRMACPACEVSVLDMNDADVARRAKSLGIRSVPAVTINGKLAECCASSGPEEATLRAAGLGQPVSRVFDRCAPLDYICP